MLDLVQREGVAYSLLVGPQPIRLDGGWQVGGTFPRHRHCRLRRLGGAFRRQISGQHEPAIHIRDVEQPKLLTTNLDRNLVGHPFIASLHGKVFYYFTRLLGILLDPPMHARKASIEIVVFPHVPGDLAVR